MKQVYVIFDGPPSHESGRFVEVETPDGHGVGPEGFSWESYPRHVSGLWRLGPFVVLDEGEVDEVRRSLQALRLELPESVIGHHSALVLKALGVER